VVQYDPKGNLTDSGNGFVYTYDSKNRLLSAVSAGMGVNLAMAYDGDNKVVSRTLNGTTRYFIYDGWSLIAEYNSTGDLVKTYVHGAGIDEILVQTQGSTDAFYHHDGLGSTVLLTNASGSIVRSYEYDAFGKVSNPPSVDNLFSADPYANRFLYTGREFLKEANLYDYRNRVYSAELGRFLQSDPIRFDAGDGNLYRYVRNAASRFIDPNGLHCRDCNAEYQACLDTAEATYNSKVKAIDDAIMEIWYGVQSGINSAINAACGGLSGGAYFACASTASAIASAILTPPAIQAAAALYAQKPTVIQAYVQDMKNCLFSFQACIKGYGKDDKNCPCPK
jgi:RHS repeat-associated protein